MLNSLHVARQVEPIWSYQVQALWCLLRQDRWFFAVLGEAFTSNEFKWHIWHIIKNTIGGELLGSSARRTHGTRRWCMWGDLASEWGGFCSLEIAGWSKWVPRLAQKICNIHAHYTSSTRIVPNLDHWNIKIRLWRQSIQVSGEVCETTPHDIPAENSETLPQFSTCRWHTWLRCPKAWFNSVSFDRQLCSMSGHSLSVYRRLVVSVWPSPRVRSANEPAVAPWHTQAGYTSRSSAFQYHYYVWSSWIVPAKKRKTSLSMHVSKHTYLHTAHTYCHILHTMCIVVCILPAYYIMHTIYRYRKDTYICYYIPTCT